MKSISSLVTEPPSSGAVLAAATGGAFDCRNCGACCHAKEGTILVSQADLVRWKRGSRSDILDRLTEGHFGDQAFAMSERGACVHLGIVGAPLDCSIYETRADVCRTYEVGNPQCLEARRERGLPAPPASVMRRG